MVKHGYIYRYLISSALSPLCMHINEYLWIEHVLQAVMPLCISYTSSILPLQGCMWYIDACGAWYVVVVYIVYYMIVVSDGE